MTLARLLASLWRALAKLHLQSGVAEMASVCRDGFIWHAVFIVSWTTVE